MSLSYFGGKKIMKTDFSHWSFKGMTLGDLIGTGDTFIKTEKKVCRKLSKPVENTFDLQLERDITRRQRDKENKIAVQQVLKGCYGARY